MAKEVLLEKVAAAKRDISAAESHLDRVVKEIQAAPRADKTTIGKVVEDAFSNLSAVRANLAELERLVDSSGS
jgi:hypothetical protein